MVTQPPLTGLRGLLFGPPEGLRLPGPVVHQPTLDQVPQLIVVELFGLDPGSLFQHDHGEPGHRQLLGHDAPGGAGTDHHEIDRVRLGEALHGSVRRASAS
jgi:hypothetical protein